MAHARWLLALSVALAALAEARAQPVFFGNPYAGGVTVSRGIGFSYGRRHLRISGFYGATYSGYGYGPVIYGPYPYGAVTINRVNIISTPPPTVIINNNNVVNAAPAQDPTAGVDLDEVDPQTLRPRRPPRERRVVPEQPARPMPEEKPRPQAVVPRPEARPRPPLPPPVEDPDRDATALDLGRRAFAAREYGLAAHHFRQAAQEDAKAALPLFLLAQAQFAVGKYRDATLAIHAGLERDKDWPTARFSARELYKANEVDFLGHLKRLEETADQHPRDPVLLFLLAYELWFDGKQDKARPIFARARKVTRDPGDIDLFLKVAR